MTGTDEGDRPADRFESARNTVLQHRKDGTCFHCQDHGCTQHAWAIEELARHPGGRKLLRQLGLPTDESTQEGQPR
ncbi:hypothetical protein C1I95_20315 [Micromonospora craterilacus]|uniref:Uncharacterized protein n=1 Tax=Micromonospora craterilacus TaxID=1655439 RepID=A0A2W2ERS9_9ACTN|nr:hypothetical protein [Micromonospora craterilacus]PZG15058.1 hypothetical protein C1I95_20315 [Micromonospora craterilacus]